MTEKIIIFDAGPIINFAMNGLMPELIKLRENFSGKFIMTNEVREEVIERPLKIKRFELEALKSQELINQGIIEFPESLGINSEEISKKTNELLDIANSTFTDREKPIKIVDKGEISAIALSQILNEKKIKNIIVIDERTTRMLCEKPENLKKLLQKKMHLKIDEKRNNFEFFKGLKIIRSSEIAYIIYKKKLTRIKNKKILEAMLYGLKYKGCAISTDEINSIIKETR